MCVKEYELVAILDEMVGAAVSMHTGAQSYDSFIKARNVCVGRIQEAFAHNEKLSNAIQDLAKLVS